MHGPCTIYLFMLLNVEYDQLTVRFPLMMFLKYTTLQDLLSPPCVQVHGTILTLVKLGFFFPTVLLAVIASELHY